MLPAEVAERLAAFLRGGKTGNLILDIKDGQVVAWKLTESGRVDKSRALA